MPARPLVVVSRPDRLFAVHGGWVLGRVQGFFGLAYGEFVPSEVRGLMVMPFAFAIWLSAWTSPHTDNCPVITEAPKSKGYVWRVLVSLNQTLNVLTGGKDADETLSSRWGRGRAHGFSRFACWLLEKFQPCHCANAIERGPDGKPLAHQLHP